MKVNSTNIKEINAALEGLANSYELIGEYYLEDPEGFNVEIGNTELSIPFPRDHEAKHKIEEFYRLISEFESLEVIDKNRVITSKFTQRVIASDTGMLEGLAYNNNFEFEVEGNIKIRIVSSPILVGISAMELGQYDKYSPPCSIYTAVEIEYPTKESRLNFHKEEELIKSYFFELSNKLNCGIFFQDVNSSGMYDTEWEEAEPKIKLKKLEKFNQGMNMFLKANQHLDPDIRLLYYYKILEFFAPVVVKINANEKLRIKLDSPNALNPNANFLQSIYELTRKYDENLRDKELVKSVFRECFDVIDLFHYLPESIKKRITGELKVQSISYELGDEKIAILANTLGGIVYSTRNSIVHAKSNYKSEKNECLEEDLLELNNFLQHACYSTIKWYNRLPKHLKIETKS